MSVLTTKVTHMGEEIEVGKRLYVENLPYRVRWQDLKDFFNAHSNAEVVYANVKADLQCGIVEFKTSQEAARAMLKMHDTEFEGRKISVRQDREDRDLGGRGGGKGKGGRGGHGPISYGGGFGGGHSGDGYERGGKRGSSSGKGCKVFVQNIAWETSWQTLKNHFRQAGEVIRADIMIDHKTGRSNGNGIVEFAYPSNPEEIIQQLNEVPLDGRPLFIREDRMPEGGKGGKGGKGYPY